MENSFIGYQVRSETVNQAFTDLLEILLLKGNRIEIEHDDKGSRSGGKTIELQSLTVLIEKPSPYIKVPPILSKVSQKFMDGMLFQSTEKPQSKRVIEQKEDVISLLKQRPHTRRASMAVWERTDLTANYSVCLAYLQFLIRDNKLHQSVVFRSWDIFNGFLYNAKGHIMLQHEIAEELGVDMGTLAVFAVSAHVYEIDEGKVRDFLLNKE